MTNQAEAGYRPGLHVHIYFWIALLAATIVPAMLLAHALTGEFGSGKALVLFAAFVAVFQALFWFGLRRCSAEELPAWLGIQYITAYMTIGIGSTSLLVATPCTILAIVIMIGIALASLLDGDAARAQHRFGSMVAWFARHRMYQ